MQRFFIIAANCVLLVAMLLGIPEIAGVRFWHWQISSLQAARTLTFWGLAMAAALNAGAAAFLIKGRKDREMCWLWAAVFVALAGGEYAYEREYFNFAWVKRSLLWLLNKF